MTYPPQFTGAGYGMHAQEPGHILPILDTYKLNAVMIASLLTVENPGLCMDAKPRGVPTTVARWLNKNSRWEGGQDADTWSPAERLAFAQAAIQSIFDRTNDQEYAGCDYFVPGYNEWNPDTFNTGNHDPAHSADW